MSPRTPPPANGRLAAVSKGRRTSPLMLMGLALLAASVAISALFAAKKAVAEIEARSDAGGSAVTVTAIVRSGDASRAHLLGGGQAGEWWFVGQAIEGWTITEIRASEVALTSGAISEGEALPSSKERRRRSE